MGRWIHRVSATRWMAGRSLGKAGSLLPIYALVWSFCTLVTAGAARSPECGGRGWYSAWPRPG